MLFTVPGSIMGSKVLSTNLSKEMMLIKKMLLPSEPNPPPSCPRWPPGWWPRPCWQIRACPSPCSWPRGRGGTWEASEMRGAGWCNSSVTPKLKAAVLFTEVEEVPLVPGVLVPWLLVTLRVELLSVPLNGEEHVPVLDLPLVLELDPLYLLLLCPALSHSLPSMVGKLVKRYLWDIYLPWNASPRVKLAFWLWVTKCNKCAGAQYWGIGDIQHIS